MKSLLVLLPLTVLAGCMNFPPPPPITPNPPGSVYRAVGHSPEWTLTIDERTIVFQRLGQAPVVEPTPPVIVGIAGEIYQTPRIGVNLPHVGCTDSVTRQRYRDRVEVTVGKDGFVGCGGEQIAIGGLPGTRWRVVAVNGRPTPAQGYSMLFESDRMAARFGCNSMGGLYRRDGDLLSVMDVSQTLIGCPEPAASFERDGALVLRQPLRMIWEGSDRLRLSSGPMRTIDLVRD